MLQAARDALYLAIEDRVLSRRGSSTEAEYLRSLRGALIGLRRRYQTAIPAADYTDPEIVDAYLLAYVPHYIQTASAAFALVPCQFLESRLKDGLRVTCVGGGPLPELIALVDRITECVGAAGSVSLTCLDLNAESWRSASADLTELARSLAPRLKIQVELRSIDLRSNSLQLSDLPTCDCLIIQNCLNELSIGPKLETLLRLLEATIAPGGIMLISDFTEYREVARAVAVAERLTKLLQHERLANFNGSALKQDAWFRKVPRRSYFWFFGFERSLETGERYFPEYCRPRRRLAFSVSASQKRSDSQSYAVS